MVGTCMQRRKHGDAQRERLTCSRLSSSTRERLYSRRASMGRRSRRAIMPDSTEMTPMYLMRESIRCHQRSSIYCRRSRRGHQKVIKSLSWFIRGYNVRGERRDHEQRDHVVRRHRGARQQERCIREPNLRDGGN